MHARREMSRLQRTLIEEVRTYAKAQGFDLDLPTASHSTPDARHHARDSGGSTVACRRAAPAACAFCNAGDAEPGDESQDSESLK